MRQVISTIVRKLQAMLFVIGLALVLFVVWLSDGRVLDPRIGVSAQSPALLAISAISWTILVIFAAKLTIGRWKTYANLKWVVLTGMLSATLSIVISSLAPLTTPMLVNVIAGVITALAAGVIANRIVHSNTGPEAS